MYNQPLFIFLIVLLSIFKCFPYEPLLSAHSVFPELISTKKIWDSAEHSAFTDLIRFQDRWYCIFREADDHAGGKNGVIHLIESMDGDIWQSLAVFSEPGVDLRDPKLSITPDHLLMLLVGGTEYLEGTILRQSRVAFSKDGIHWTDFTKVLEPHEWLWRVTWHQGKAYGISYRSSGLNEDEDWLATLFMSEDGVNFKKIKQLDVIGYPSEGTVRFLDSGEMITLIRRGGHAWVGISKTPYEDWVWSELKSHLGGPNFLILPDQSMWASGRIIEKNPQGKMIEKNTLAKMKLDGIERVLDLPSGGKDTGYPGMVYHEGIFWISYYSSHEDEKAAIYLAKVKIFEDSI